MPNKIPQQVLEIADRLRKGEQVRRRTVRSVLKWFGAARRGSNILPDIKTALAGLGIRTEPELQQTELDSHVRFLLSDPASSDNATAADVMENDASAPLPNGGPAPDAGRPLATNLAGSDGEAVESDDQLEPDNGEEEVVEARPDERPVTSQSNDWNIWTLREKLDRGFLELQPTYQREYVWSLKPELPSRLIESLLLEIPIPPLYFGRVSEGSLEVIDGQQRLRTFIDFVSNKFALTRLHSMHNLNGKFFRDLTKEQQEKIRDATIRSIVIDAAGRPELRYEIFERLNRGSMVLNEQEIRNCAYRGPFNDLLIGLEREHQWRRVKGGDVPERRFKEREMILRFFAFGDRQPQYTGNLKRFLNEYMGKYPPREPEDLRAHAVLFRQTMQNIYAVFGEKSARQYEISPRTGNGKWDTKFLVTVFDIQAAALMNRPPAKVQKAAEQIRELFLFTMLTDSELQEAISKRTGSTEQTRIRWTKFRGLVDSIIDGTLIEPRFFDFQFRKELYDMSPICKLCTNEIHSLEDSTVDHITPYSKGGKTVPENAQLAHRGCNARKNAQLPPAASAAGAKEA
ncbi:MAG: HNH endonuclease family protein [Terriglobales bacterium]